MDKILQIFVEEPDRELHVREISRKLKKSPATISKYLKNYKNESLLLSENKLNHLIFRANTKSPRFKNIKREYNIERILSSGLIELLKKELNNPESITLFGSFSNGENNKDSDIDIFVITPLKKNINLKEYERKLGHEIQLFVNSREDIQRMKEKNKELLNSVINGIVLEGSLELFR